MSKTSFLTKVLKNGNQYLESQNYPQNQCSSLLGTNHYVKNVLMIYSTELQQTQKKQDSEGALAYLNALPLPSCGLKLSNIELPIVCASPIGSTLCQPHTCFCSKVVKSDGRHRLSCSQQVGRFPRHTEANYLIKRALSQINFPSILEPSNLVGVEGLIPDGVTVFPYRHYARF